MGGVLMSVINALTAMKTSQAFVRSISTNTDVLRVHWQGLGVATQAWNPQPWAGATGHKPQMNRGGWCCQGSGHAHKLQFTFLTDTPLGPSFLAELWFPSINSHIPSLCCAPSLGWSCLPSQYHCDTHPGASKGLTQQEQNKLLLSSQRFGIKMSNETGRQPAEKILSYHTKQTRMSEKPSWVLSCGTVPCSQEFVVLGRNPVKVCCPSSLHCDIYLPSP